MPNRVMGGNPWVSLPRQAPYVLPEDLAVLDGLRREYGLHLDVLPAPYAGDPERATVCILTLNPGYAETDHEDHLLPRYFDQRIAALTFKAEWPFPYLDPQLATTGGGRYWQSRLRRVLAEVGDAKRVAQRLMIVGAFPVRFPALRRPPRDPALAGVQLPPRRRVGPPRMPDGGGPPLARVAASGPGADRAQRPGPASARAALRLHLAGHPGRPGLRACRRRPQGSGLRAGIACRRSTMPEWITLRKPEPDGHIATARAPFDPGTTAALVRAARRVRADPPRPMVEPRFSVYVVLLEFGAGEYGLYVGETGLTPEERYLNHKAGHKASKWPRRYGIGLLPALYRHLNPLDWEPATKAEVALAAALGRTGVRVEQG
jgi:hypothetical protein